LPAAESAAPAKPDLAKGPDVVVAGVRRLPTRQTVHAAARPIPSSAGQHPEYLAKQLGEFKSGKRNNPVMKGFASTLSDSDMRDVAAFYSGKQTKPGAAKNKDLYTLGQKIYRGGIADKQVPACAGCHSPTGAGIPAQYPRVGGQPCRLQRKHSSTAFAPASAQQRTDGGDRCAPERPRDQGGGRLHAGLH